MVLTLRVLVTNQDSLIRASALRVCFLSTDDNFVTDALGSSAHVEKFGDNQTVQSSASALLRDKIIGTWPPIRVGKDGSFEVGSGNGQDIACSSSKYGLISLSLILRWFK